MTDAPDRLIIYVNATTVQTSVDWFCIIVHDDDLVVGIENRTSQYGQINISSNRG